MSISDRLRTLARLTTAVALGSAISLGGAAAAHAATAPALAGSAHASQPALTAANSGSTHVCSDAAVVGKLSCQALKRDGVSPVAAAASPDAIPSGVGYGPSQLQSAYNLTSASAADGSGRTVAIVDAYNDPTAASDLAAYRSAAGLPTVPSFKVVNQNGATSPLPSTAPSSDDWTLEESLDVDMASAVCPLCNIVLVEANDDTSDGLYVAENTAASLAGYVSNSWGGTEASTDTTLDSEYFSHSGVVITASAGDSDYGVIYPATSPNVVSVGGTSLSTSSNSRGWTESVWNTTTGSEGTGSGCSAYEPQPSWQTALGLTGCSERIDNDVAADADPATGVAVYDTTNGNGGWNEVGGTSASSPMLAAMYALGGSAGTTPAQDIYTHTANFYDVTSGKDASSCSPAYLCTAETGYDGPTGIGTPDGITGLTTGTTTTNTVTVTNPGSQTGTVGTAASLQISASDSASGQTLTYSATGLPAGLSISTSGLISGTPTTSGSNTVTVTAKDTTGASGTASFTWTINAATGNTVTVTNPGSKTGTVGTAASLQISASDSASGQTLTYSATGLPAGLSISTSGLISGTPTTAATYSVTVTAKDTTGASGSATFTWTISAASGGGCTAAQLIGNPGFETGAISPWTATSGVLNNDTVDEPAHSGSWDAWLDGYGTTHTDTLAQKVTIPSTCTTATFSFWLHIDTAETTTTTAYDTLKVQVLNSSGTVLGTLATFSNLNHITGYAQHSYSLASYIGQTVTLKFTGAEDSSLQTSFVIDDNALNVD
ncbi:putative Ig domain-containing protein [Actinospica durhamensis]|uniref:Ig domain-containing protein n=1 Tax=Actinospica durhamensis TaxID=1508375 RepID=A0A941EVC8_9ACTN|nr:S53 family peptidase [Actinospica durhamensis]MBR7837961.1 putative Ig domain-containing protein [Actinospica durhamensis]